MHRNSSTRNPILLFSSKSPIDVIDSKIKAIKNVIIICVSLV